MFSNKISSFDFEQAIASNILHIPLETDLNPFDGLYISDLKCIQSEVQNGVASLDVALVFGDQDVNTDEEIARFQFDWSGVMLDERLLPVLLARFESCNSYIFKAEVLEVSESFRGYGINTAFQKNYVSKIFDAHMSMDFKSAVLGFGHHDSLALAKHFISCGRFFRHELTRNWDELSSYLQDDCFEFDIRFVDEQNAMNLHRSTWILNPRLDPELLLSESTLSMSNEQRYNLAEYYWKKSTEFRQSYKKLFVNSANLTMKERGWITGLIKTSHLSSDISDQLLDYVSNGSKLVCNPPYAHLQIFGNEIFANYYHYFKRNEN